MPLLPTQDVNVNAVDLGQGPSIARAGDTWDAVASVGDKIGDFGSELASKRKQAEISSYVNTSKNDFERFVSEKETQYQSQFAGDPTGYSRAMNEDMNSWYEERRETAPNDDAKNIWEQNFAGMSNQIGMRADAWENQSRAKYQVGQIDESVRKDAQHLAQKPDITKAAQFLVNTQKMVQDGVGLYYDETEAKDRLNKYSASTAGALFEGMEANKQYAAGLKLLDGKDPNSAILVGGMDPKQIGAYKDRFKRLAESENEFSKSMFNQEAGDVSYALQKGMKISPDKIQQMVKGSEQLKPDERKVFLDNLNQDIQYNDVLNKMKTLPIEDVKSGAGFQVKFDGDETFNIRAREQKADIFKKAAADILDKRVNSPADYHFENDKSIESLALQAKDVNNIGAINQYTKSIVSKQEMDKVPTPQIMNKDMAESYSTMLKSQNPAMAEQAYQAMKNGMQIGDTNYARNAISDMVKMGKLTPEYGIALALEDKTSRQSALSNIIKKKEIDAAYSTLKKSTGDRENEFEVIDDSDVTTFKNAIQNATKGTDSLGILNGVNDLLVLEYKAGRTNNMSASAAKRAAIEKVVKSNFGVAKGGNSQLILAGDHVKNKAQIQDFILDSTLPKNLKDRFDIAVPEKYNEVYAALGENPKDKYLQDLYKTGEWVTNSAQNGAVFYRRLPNGGRSMVRDTKGNPISMKYDQMVGKMRNPAKAGF